MAADAIWQITGDNSHVLTIAGKMLEDEDYVLCARACAVLGEQGEAAQPYAKKLQQLQQHSNAFVRQAASEALVRCWFG
jgi:HEAT repeat protein